MKKLFMVLLVVFSVVIDAKAQLELEDMIVLREDLDSCNIIRPDVMPKDMEISFEQIYYSKYYSTALKYPKEAIKNHIRGTVLCTFHITKEGKITDYKVYKGLGYGLDEVALNYARLVNEPTSPAEYQGETVDLLFMIAVGFKYEPAWPRTIAKDFSMEKLIDEEAILIGSECQGRRCINDLSEMEYDCRVPYVRFVVKHINGKIAKVKIERSSGFHSLDEEAIAAVWSINYWEKGRLQKDAEYIIPVRFDANLQPLENTENQDE